MSKFTIGCDPEIFLTKGRAAYSAHGVVQGTKKEPYACTAGAYQVDGMAVEFNTDPVLLQSGAFEDRNAHNAFIENVGTVMSELKSAVAKHDPELKFNLSSVQEFSEDVFKAQPKEAIELGCDPDFNAYTGKVNPRPEGEAVNFRTASGHIHIGWDEGIPVNHPEHMEICSSFIKLMDATVGLFMTIIDVDPRRRVLYGKAGAFRPKSYGVEYRTPSNVWLVNDNRKRMIFELSRIAVIAAKNQYTASIITGYTEDQIEKIINEGDFEKAYEALTKVLAAFYLGGWKGTDVLISEYRARKGEVASARSARRAEQKKKKKDAMAQAILEAKYKAVNPVDEIDLVAIAREAQIEL